MFQIRIGEYAIPGVDLKRLRLFFLSLLWRAAETKLAEFSAVKLCNSDLDRLRIMVRTGETDPLNFYPITLIQLSTRGLEHNFSVDTCVKTNPGFGEVPDLKIPHFQFYFDGLIVHIHREVDGQMNKSILGANSRLIVTTLSFQGSRQRQNLISALGQARVDYAVQIGKSFKKMLARPSLN